MISLISKPPYLSLHTPVPMSFPENLLSPNLLGGGSLHSSPCLKVLGQPLRAIQSSFLLLSLGIRGLRQSPQGVSHSVSLLEFPEF